MVSAGAPSTIQPILVGIANAYSSYVVTNEEYQVGKPPHTLKIQIQ